MRAPIAVVLTGLLLTLSSSLSAQLSVRRLAPDSLWRRVWLVGADQHSELFVEPRQVVVSRDAVVVLDMGTREVRSFDAKSGEPRLVMPARGLGPGEFKRPAALIATPSGFAIVDHAAARLTAFSRKGQPEWDFVVPDVFAASDVCLRDAGRVLVSYRRRDSSLVEFDTAGRRLATRTVPWNVKRRTPVPFAHESHLSVGTSTGECALVPLYGREWALVGGPAAAAPRVLPYIEAGDEPVMQTSEKVVERSLSRVVIQGLETTETNSIVKAALVHGDTAILVGAHSREFPHRLLDYYDIRTGKYLYSRKLPFTVIALAIGTDGTFFATIIDAKVQALVAMRPERVSKEYLDRVKKATPARADTSARRPPAAFEPSPSSR
jgi:hypothetical protein